MTRGADIQAVTREGKRIRTTHLDVRVSASPLGVGRVGFVVPKSGQSSVRRNQLKRRLRELARLRLLPEMPAYDVVIRTRRETYGVDMSALRADVERIRAGLARLPRHPRESGDPPPS